MLNLTKKPDIIAITETKLNNNNIAKTQLNNYDLINCNSLTKAGGVALYVPNSLIFSKIEELSTATTHYESLFIEIDVKNKKQKNLVIGVFYRHPSSLVLEFQTQIVHTLNNLTQRKKEYIICGDFNVDILKKSSITNTYKDHVYAEGCFCLIDKPTRITPHSATSLDHFFSNIIDKNLTSTVLLYEIFDHLPITCFINLIPDQINYQQKLHRDTDKFDEENFLDDVSDLVEKLSNDLSSTKQNITAQIDKTCAQFISKFSETVNTHAPLKPLSKRKSRQRKKPWMTKGIIKSISTKNKLYAKCYQKTN